MNSKPASSPFPARQERLRALMETRNVHAILVTHLPNVRYLSGFTGSAGILLVRMRDATLWVDPRYTLQAREQSEGVEVVEEKDGILKGVSAWLRKNSVRGLGFESAVMTFSQYDFIRREGGEGLELSPAGDLIEGLRIVKDRGEIDSIRKACIVTGEVFTELLPKIRPGVSENDLAAEIEFRMRRKGAEGAAFETIVASGARGAYPHARPTSKVLQDCEFIIFDMGAIVDGYAADMTRTVYLGEPTRRARSLYSAVLKAQEGAIRAVEDSTLAAEVDVAARRILAKHGLARYFTHSTGHGVGLEIHERPRLGKGETASLRTGSVVTVEPGVYLEGFGGIRIEDTVLVGAEGPEILTLASKEFCAIG